MEWRDLTRFLLAFCISFGVGLLLAWIAGEEPKEADAFVAAAWGAAYMILCAVREHDK